MIKSVDMCVIVLRDIPANTAIQVVLFFGPCQFLYKNIRFEGTSLSRIVLYHCGNALLWPSIVCKCDYDVSCNGSHWTFRTGSSGSEY